MNLLRDFFLIFIEYAVLRPGFFIYDHKKIIAMLILLIGVFFFREQIFDFFSYVAVLYKNSSSGDKLLFLGGLITLVVTILFSRK